MTIFASDPEFTPGRWSRWLLPPELERDPAIGAAGLAVLAVLVGAAVPAVFCWLFAALGWLA